MITKGNEIRLIKQMGVFDNIGEVCEVTDVSEDGVISFKFGGCHLGCMSYNEFEKYFELVEEENTEEVIEVPRPRGIYETDEEYTRYLQDFYGTVPEEELIPGTNFRKPRRRGDYETDEEYVDFLEKYYTEIFGEEVVEKSKTR